MRPSVFLAALGTCLVIGFFAGRCSSPASHSPIATHAPLHSSADTSIYRGKVVKIVDGDTLDILLSSPSRTTERVRLLGIDAPERGHPLFSRARDTLAAVSLDREVYLEFTASQPLRDRYGRLLAFVWVGDKNVNAEMVRSGFAVFSATASPSDHDMLLAESEEHARGNHLGLWLSRAPKR